MSSLKKKRQIKIWCDDEEYAYIDYKARSAGMSRTEFMRTLLYHGNIEYHINYTPEDAQRLLSEFCKISNSMAQIEYSARLKLGVDEGEFLQLESNFKALFDVIGNHITG